MSPTWQPSPSRVTDFTAFARSISGQYRIERELGHGGFATVFLAQDLRHDRPVALKVLHPDIAASLGTERFKLEIRLAARLQHPHVVGVLDSGQSDDLLWFTMPFVEGESLRHRLLREKQLPIDVAVQIAREVADALDFAHRQGVIHRDIKPENILLSESHAMVADFGIARSLSAGAITQTGLSLGTPAYMSPEQASDTGAVDARTDVYALGCVLYEMLAGEPPFTGPSTNAILARVLTQTPQPLRSARPLVSPALEAACAKAMARVPADRFATAAEFGTALATAAGQMQTPAPVPTAATAATVPMPPVPAASHGRRPRLIGAAVAAVIAILLAGAWFAWPHLSSNRTPDVRRLAVLPFENLGAHEDDYFAVGITDEVRGKLTALDGFEVIARSSAIQYTSTSGKSPKQIGQELGVAYLLTGTVRWEGQGEARRVRVSPELIDASTGTTRWQRPFERTVSGVFEMQGEIASSVASALDVALAGNSRATLDEKPTTNVAAYEAFLRGEQIVGSLAPSSAARRNAITNYQQAVTLDPSFLQAWVRLGIAACGLSSASSAADVVELCRSGAERATALAPQRPETHLIVGTYLRALPKEFDKALERFTLGLKQQPNNIELLTAATSTERSLGRFDDALVHAQQAARLDPRSVAALSTLARTYRDTHRHREADVEYGRALALAPANLSLIQSRATNCVAQGNLDCARGAIATGLQHVTVKELVARFATFGEMMWVLPNDLRAEVLKLQPADFDNDRGMWALKVGATYLLANDVARARSYGRIAADEYGDAVKRRPDDAQTLELHGRALVLAGESEAGIEAGERSLARRETTQDVINGVYYKYQVVRIYIQAGRHDRALELLEPLVGSPGDVTPGWLRLDPVFAPLRGNPRFERLLKTKSS